MGYIAWVLDIAGFVVFVMTHTVGMYVLGAGICGLGVVLAHKVMYDEKAEVEDRLRCASARSSGLVSIAIIGVSIVLAGLKLLG
jgi:hypothetical protein